MARILQKLLKINGPITKKSFGFGLGDMNGFEQSGLVMYDPHATTAAASRCFDNHRIADTLGECQSAIVVIVQRAIRARHRGNSRITHNIDGGDFVPHHFYGFCGWPDENKPAVFNLLSEIRVFRKKAIAGMHAIGIG